MGLLRRGGEVMFAGRFPGINDIGDESVAAFGESLNEARLTGVVAEELAQVEHVGAQNLWLDVSLGPQLVEKFVVGDETAGILNEVTQDRERLGRESHCEAVAEQALITRIEPEGPKLLHSDRTSG